jgi:hypothetical protein
MEIENTRVFSIDWADLKAAMQSTIAGNPPAMRIADHAVRFREYLTKSRSRWTGFSDADVKRWLERGYKLDGLNFDNPPIPIREKRRLVFEDEGEEFHLDRAYSGEDTAFSQWTTREVIPGLAIEAEICFSAATDHSILTSYFQFLCRAIYSLEKSGIDLQVSLKSTVRSLYQKSPSIQSTLIRVKRENEATDFQSWSAMLSPASLRAYAFCAMLLHADSENKVAAYGLGQCNVPGLDGFKVSWNAERRVIEIKVSQHGSRAFPTEDMEAQLRAALKEIHG